MDELIKDLREWPRICIEYTGSLDELHDKAADAIEELQAVVDGLKAQTNMVFEETEGRTVIKFEPKWIPVTERLPENDGWYLVYAPDYRGGSSSGLKCVDGKMFCKFAKGKWSIEHGYYNRPGCVTHWMPLPEPPKEE